MSCPGILRTGVRPYQYVFVFPNHFCLRRICERLNLVINFIAEQMAAGLIHTLFPSLEDGVNAFFTGNLPEN